MEVTSSTSFRFHANIIWLGTLISLIFIVAFPSMRAEASSSLSTTQSGLPLCGGTLCSRAEQYERIKGLRDRQLPSSGQVSQPYTEFQQRMSIAYTDYLVRILFDQLDSLNRIADAKVPYAARNGSVTLSWHAPNRREGGQWLGIQELLRYEIHLRYNWQNRVKIFLVNDPTLSSVTLNGLAPGKAFVQMVAVDEYGFASKLSTARSVIVK